MSNMLKRKFIAGSAALALMILTAPVVLADGPGQTPSKVENGRWAVMAESSLRNTLDGWARSEGWSLIWDSPIDYRIRASATFDGGFEDAVGRLVDAIYQSNPELFVTLYRGNKVIHVEHAATATN